MISFLIQVLGFAISLQAFEHLEVLEVRESNHSYDAFCELNPEECDVLIDANLQYSDELYNQLVKVNVETNKETAFILDSDQYGEEEKWNLPTKLGGDCEDNALLKRKILVEKYGLKRSAIRMVTAFHKDQFYAHALLAVLTDNGAFILDQDEDKVFNATKANYIFEAMELPGRRWLRFVQEW